MPKSYQEGGKTARQFRVRDHRKKEMFKVDDEYLNGYARICGLAATGVYLSLCRHSDRDQESWPSIRLMGEELGITTRTVIRAIKTLEGMRIIEVTREKGTNGRQAVNVYVLTDKSEWNRVTPGQPEPGDKNDVHRVTKTTSDRVTPGQRKVTQREGDTVEGYAAAAKAATAAPVEKVKDDTDPMTLDTFVASCDASPQRHINLIGAYAEAVRPELHTKGQWRTFIKRNLRPAKELSVFTTDQISGAFAKIKDAEKEGWLSKFTMETLLKFLI